VRWDGRDAAGVGVHYQVWRSEPERPAADRRPPPVLEGLRCRDEGGAIDCAVEMDLLGTTDATTFVDRPPPGRWVYRVGLLAGWRGEPETADLFVVSGPATVDVGR
jgi:hypothetical protein